MSYKDLHVAEETMHQRADEAVQRAQLRGMAREARAQQRRWLYRQMCQVLVRAGHLLVLLGEWLKRFEVAPSLPLKGQVSGGR